LSQLLEEIQVPDEAAQALDTGGESLGQGYKRTILGQP